MPSEPVVLVMEGDSAELRIRYSTTYLHDKVNIEWFLGAKSESNRVLASTRVTLMENNTVLRIDGVTGQDTGSYIASVALLRGAYFRTGGTIIKLDILGKFIYIYHLRAIGE